MAKFNYILNDLALINLVTRNLYSKNVCREDKEELENQIKLIMQENQQLKDKWNKLKEWVNKSYDYYINNADYIGGRLCFTDMKNNMRELEQGGEIND